MKLVQTVQEQIHHSDFDQEICFVYSDLSEILKHLYRGFFFTFKKIWKEISNLSFSDSNNKILVNKYIESSELGNIYFRRCEFDEYIIEWRNLDILLYQAKRKGKNSFELNDEQEFWNYIYFVSRYKEMMNNAEANDVVCFEWMWCKNELIANYGSESKAKKAWIKFLKNHESPYYWIELDKKIQEEERLAAEKELLRENDIKQTAIKTMKENENFQNWRDDFLNESTFQNQLNYFVSFWNMFKLEKFEDRYIYRDLLNDDFASLGDLEIIKPKKSEQIALFYTDNKGSERIKFPKQKTINGMDRSASEYSFSVHATEMNMYLYNWDLYDISGFEPFDLAMEAGLKFKECAFKIFDIKSVQKELQDEAWSLEPYRGW